MNIKAVAGSRIRWNLQFDKPVDSVFLQSTGTNVALILQNNSYTVATVLNYSGFYNFKFKDLQGNEYSSNLYRIIVTRDKQPEIKLTGIDEFTSLDFNQESAITFNSLITDDYGIDEAYIIATVSKGSGESIKFREEQLSFDETIKKRFKKIKPVQKN